jgi:hypothetical protein
MPLSAASTSCRGSARRNPVQVGNLDDVPDHPADLERDRGADAGGDDMRVLEPERVGDGDDELAHRLRGQ